VKPGSEPFFLKTAGIFRICPGSQTQRGQKLKAKLPGRELVLGHKNEFCMPKLPCIHGSFVALYYMFVVVIRCLSRQPQTSSSEPTKGQSDSAKHAFMARKMQNFAGQFAAAFHAERKFRP
jgi:hypothetical protein